MGADDAEGMKPYKDMEATFRLIERGFLNDPQF